MLVFCTDVGSLSTSAGSFLEDKGAKEDSRMGNEWNKLYAAYRPPSIQCTGGLYLWYIIPFLFIYYCTCVNLCWGFETLHKRMGTYRGNTTDILYSISDMIQRPHISQ